MSETQEAIDKIRKMHPRNAEEALERIFLALADKLDAQEAELTRLREENATLTRERDGYQHHLRACEQIAGKALGYPWFKDDPKNFPGATEDDGVCIGDHVGDTIVEELATAYTKLRAERDEALEAARQSYLKHVMMAVASETNACQRRVSEALRRAASLITKGGADV